MSDSVRPDRWQPTRLPCPLDSPGKNTGVGCHFLILLNVCAVASDSVRIHGLQPARLLCPWNFPGKDTEVGCHFLLQGIFPTQGSNPQLLCLLHWQVGSLPLVPPGKPGRCIFQCKDQVVQNIKLYYLNMYLTLASV